MDEGLSAAGVVALANSTRLAGLEALHIGGLNDDAARAFVDSTGLPALRELDALYSPDLDPDIVAALEARYEDFGY
jgi:hypothetical protein